MPPLSQLPPKNQGGKPLKYQYLNGIYSWAKRASPKQLGKEHCLVFESETPTLNLTRQKRAEFRRGRRFRLRSRKKRFNRSSPEGWLAPSLMHRLKTV